jgi:hypothetical protein
VILKNLWEGFWLSRQLHAYSELFGVTIEMLVKPRIEAPRLKGRGFPERKPSVSDSFP